MLFDTHAHLDDRKYDRDRDEMLRRARDNGVELIVNVGYDLESCRRSLELASKYDFIYAAVGIHPHDAKLMDEKVLDMLKEMAGNPKVVAIGEIGLDYYRDLSPREIQQEVFRQQLNLAREVKLPVVIHDRDAHGDILKILRAEKAEEIGGILHCFSGSVEVAKECVKMGFYISIAGPVTFHNAHKLREVAVWVPLDRLLVETDAPYLTPEPYRGKRNESAYVFYVAKKIAEMRGITLEELAAATLENGKRVFGIK